MRYLIIQEIAPPYFTKWYEPDNFDHTGLMVIDTSTNKFTRDGINWQEIEYDHL
jgi:hypothetical protein